jgi:hypothetical protein
VQNEKGAPTYSKQIFPNTPIIQKWSRITDIPNHSTYLNSVNSISPNIKEKLANISVILDHYWSNILATRVVGQSSQLTTLFLFHLQNLDFSALNPFPRCPMRLSTFLWLPFPRHLIHSNNGSAMAWINFVVYRLRLWEAAAF